MNNIASIRICPICTMEALRVSTCKNGGVTTYCASCFTRLFLRDMRALSVIAKIGEHYRSKGHVNKIQYVDITFEAWREHNQEALEQLESDRVRVMAAAAAKGVS